VRRRVAVFLLLLLRLAICAGCVVGRRVLGANSCGLCSRALLLVCRLSRGLLPFSREQILKGEDALRAGQGAGREGVRV
jgi:hypothetical protein